MRAGRIVATLIVTAITWACPPSATLAWTSADHLEMTTDTTTATAGVSFQVTVTARDPNGDVDAAFAGTIHFTTTDDWPGYVLPPDSELVGGEGTFSVTLTRAFVSTDITASDAADSLSTTVQIMVANGPADHFAFFDKGRPINAGVGAEFFVSVRDRYDNGCPDYAGTVHFTSSDTSPGVVLPADSRVYTGGPQIFGFILDKAGPQTITATDVASPQVTGTYAFYVHPGDVKTIRIDAPATVTTTKPFDIVVTLFDAFGNVVTDGMFANYPRQIHFTSSDLLATLPPDYTFTSADRGSRTFSGVVLVTPGTQTIGAHDVARPTIAGSTTVNVTLPLLRL